MRPTAGSSVAALATLVLLSLAACAPAEGNAPVASPTATDAAPAPTATATAVPAPDDTSEAGGVPVECETVDLTPGGTVAGEELGPCLQAALVQADTGTVTLSGAELGGTVQYRHSPAFAFAGELETGDGAVEMSFIDDVMTLDAGDGPIIADPESADPDEQLAGITGELYRVFSDPAFIAELIAAGDTWRIGSEPEEVTPAGGEPVTATRIESAAPFSWYDIPIEDYTVLVAEDFTPVTATSTTGFLGRSASMTQEFTGIGGPVSIEPVG